MIQAIGAVLVVFMLAAPAAVAGTATAAGAPEEQRDSGTLVAVASDGSSIVIEEMGSWRGPGTGVVTRSIHIPASATVSFVEHTGRWEGPTPGWSSKTIAVSSLRPGDFVTVTEKGQSGEAIALQVVRPSSSPTIE